MSNQNNLIPLSVFGMAMSLFFLISYVICVIGYLILPEWTAIPHHTLELLLPGFKLLTVGSFILGVIEAYVVGWYIALLFGALYNYCRRWA
jgi:2TM family of unknown function (DUF5676)